MSNQCFRRIHPSRTPSTMSERERALVQAVVRTKELLEIFPDSNMDIQGNDEWIGISNVSGIIRITLFDGSEIWGSHLSFSMIGRDLIFTLSGPPETTSKSVTIDRGGVLKVMYSDREGTTNVWRMVGPDYIGADHYLLDNRFLDSKLLRKPLPENNGESDMDAHICRRDDE